MKLHKPTGSRRAGFTLIELLVVISIIAILMALSASAVIKIMGKGPELQSRRDIENLQASVTSFQTKHEVDHIPSRIVLREQIGSYGTSQVEIDSLTYLKRIFGRQLGEGIPYVDWNGNGTMDANPVTLQGQECLVFFLGGIPNAGSPPACQGFSDSPRNPAQPGGARKGPYFQFESGRLVSRYNPGYLVYLDPYRSQPYAYFSSYGRSNGYNRYLSSDCASLNVQPYQASSTTYVNPTGFQIIMAGKNTAFGPGGLWGPNNPAQGPGADDMSNFHSKILGAP